MTIELPVIAGSSDVPVISSANRLNINKIYVRKNEIPKWLNELKLHMN